MSTLIIEGLRAAVDGQEILKGVDLEVGSGEVHAVMGPNGSGKSTLSHVIAGRPGYEVLGGSVRIDDVELLDKPTWQRAEAGLFLAMQYPTEVPGVALRDLLTASVRTPEDPADIAERMRVEAERIGFGAQFLERPLNVDLSGGEKKRNETLQLGVLAITHYSRLFEQLKPDTVHVFADGVIQESGGPELATELEDTGYERWVTAPAPAASAGLPDDPFADPLA